MKSVELGGWEFPHLISESDAEWLHDNWHDDAAVISRFPKAVKRAVNLGNWPPPTPIHSVSMTFKGYSFDGN